MRRFGPKAILGIKPVSKSARPSSAATSLTRVSDRPARVSPCVSTFAEQSAASCEAI